MGEERRVVDPAEGVDAIGDATLRAVHRLEVAAEWIERAFGGNLLDPVRRVEERVRAGLTGGVRHRYEARMKRDTPGATSTTEVRLPTD